MKHYPRLFKRNSTYYIRVVIPEKIQFLIKKKEIKYSLNSNNYYDALQKLRSESFKIDRFFDVMELMAMEIKNKQLILTDADVHKMIIEKLKSVNRQIDLAYLDIRSNRKELKPDNYTTFQPKESVEDPFVRLGSDEDYQKFITENHIRNYLKDVKFDKRTDANLSYVLKHLRENGITIPQDADYFKLAMVNLVLVDEYIKQRFSDIQNNTTTPTTPQIQRYLEAINLEQNQEALLHPRLNVTIKQLKDEFIQYRRDTSTIEDGTVNDNIQHLETVLALINKKYVRNITFKDCQTVSNLMRKVPKRWRLIYKNRKLLDIVKDDIDRKNLLSAKTIKDYLLTFRSFLKYAQRQRLLNESIKLDVDIEFPQQIKASGEPRTSFTQPELKIIFNSETYPNKNNIKIFPRFWVPLIALFTGMREGEICQLYVDDIKKKKNIYYFDLTDERPDQTLKTKQSKRIVPIHPKLIELGFIEFYKNAKSRGEKRLFYTLNYSKIHGYIRPICRWFNERGYLYKIGVKRDESKVFHCFRKNAKIALRDAGVSQEIVRKLLGWEGEGVDEQHYGNEPLDVQIAYDALAKLQYPFLNETLNKLK